MRASRPFVVAHRGAATVAPEHTIPAYEAAVGAGANALWLDVQESADQQLVVVHDLRLERTTNGVGPVRERFRDRVGFVVALGAGSDVYPGIEERALGLLHLYGAAERTLVASHDHHALARCRALDGDIRLGARVTARLLAPGSLAPPGTLTALCLDAALVVEADVTACRDAGLDSYLGVVTGAADARRLAAWHPTALVMGSGFDF